jgi:hypothetical protein
VAKLADAQRMVLQAVLDLPKDAAGYVTEIQLARSTRFEESNVRDLLATLKEEGYVDLAPTTEGLSVSISARGRLALKLSHVLASASSSPPAWLEISTTWMMVEASDYLYTFRQTLSKPNLKFPVIRDAIAYGQHGSSAAEKLNPELLRYVVISILLGVSLQSVYQVQGLAFETWKSLLVVLSVWLGLGSCLAYLIRALWRSRLSFSNLLSSALQIFSTLYLLSNFITFLLTVILAAYWKAFPPGRIYLVVHGVLLTVYLFRALLSWRAEEADKLGGNNLTLLGNMASTSLAITGELANVAIISIVTAVKIVGMFMAIWCFIAIALMIILSLGAILIK